MPIRLLLALSLACAAALGQGPSYTIETLLGAELPPSVPALEWNFNQQIYAMTLDSEGSLWFMEASSFRKLTRDGKLMNVPIKAGIGGCSGIRLDPYYSLAFGPDGLLYFYDPWCRVIRRLRPDGSHEIFAGRLDAGAEGNGGPAREATLGQVQSILFDAAGNLLMVERSSESIRRIDTRGNITRVATLGTSHAWGIAIDRAGNLYVSERWLPFRIFKITPAGDRTVFATGDGYMFELAFDNAGNLYGRTGSGTPVKRFTPDGKAAVLAKTENLAAGFAVDPAGNIHFGDTMRSLAVASPDGQIRRVAGTGITASQASMTKYTILLAGTNSPSLDAITRPSDQGMWLGATNAMYLLDRAGSLQRMLNIGAGSLAMDSTGSLFHTANCAVFKLDSAQNGARLSVIPLSETWCPSSLTFDEQDNLYIGTWQRPHVRRLDRRTGAIGFVAGTGNPGDSGDGGPAMSADLRFPIALASSRAGDLYIADALANRIRRVNPAGTISTAAGAAGTSAVATDVMGNVYFSACDPAGSLIRMIDRQGTVRTIAGGPDNVTAADGMSSLRAKIGCGRSLAAGADGSIYFVDDRTSVRRLIPQVTEFPRVAAGGAVHGATFLPGAVAPGMLLTVFGSNLGTASIDRAPLVNGRLDIHAGPVSVKFDGVPAAMVYSSAGQVAAMVPYSVRPGRKVSMVVVVNLAESTPVELDVVEARPGLFTADSSGKSQGAILNENGSVNSTLNPADAGSIVVLFGTGEGQTSPAGVDGRIAAGTPLPRPLAPVGVTICGQTAPVLYAGAAPSLPAGVMQVNARISAACAGLSNAEVRVTVGNSASPTGVTVAVK